MNFKSRFACRRAFAAAPLKGPTSPARRESAHTPGRLPDAWTPSPSRRSGFTMIEIALCLAIIGFALVAIIGVLPTGLNVQKDNREETIINQDAAVWMDAVRSGAQGYDDLTNYVIAITNTTWSYTIINGTPQLNGTVNRAGMTGGSSPQVDVYTRTFWMRDGTVQGSPQFLLNSGSHIIGVLSTPRLEWINANNFFSNSIVANVRAISGSAVEKFPENNPAVLDSAFSYRMIAQNDDYLPFAPAITNLTPDFTNGMTAAQLSTRVNTSNVVNYLLANAHDLRLTFRWPLLPNGDAGNGRQTFRTFSGGQLFLTNDPTPGVEFQVPLYFLQPSTYAKAQ